MSQALDDRRLVEQSISGSKEAFGVLVSRYQSLICALTYSATGSVEHSEELAQEAFLRAWKNLRQLNDVSRFRTWLCTIARNLARRAIKRRGRDVVGQAAGLDAAQSVTDDADPAERLVSRERRETVWAALKVIPLKYREPMVLFYRDQRSVSQVAADLDLSEHVVRQRLYRGRQLLKAEVSSVVEDTLGRSGPGKMFAVAVVAALPALGTQTASAAVAGVATKGAPAAKTFFATGLSGAILGPILGLLGGILGAWCSIKNTNSPRERRFMIRMTILVWLLLLLCIGLPLPLMLTKVVPTWFYWTCFTMFFCVLIPLIVWGNARQRRIQIEDGTCRRPEPGPARITRPGIYSSLGGAVFGGTLWLLILAGLVKDWMLFGVILGGDLLLFWVATATVLRKPKRYWSVACLAFCVLIAGTFAAVNLRWMAWMRAYRQSFAYDPRNDVSLKTMNLVLLGVLVGLLLLFAIQHACQKTREDRPTDT